MRPLLLLTCLATASIASAHKPESLALKAGDKDGAVAFKAQRYPDNYYINVARLEQDGRTSGFWRVPVTASFRIDPVAQALLPGAVKLSALKLKPGRYVFKTLNQNAHWEGCLWASTLAFDVKPGIVSYIGNIDFSPVKVSLIAAAGENATAFDPSPFPLQGGDGSAGLPRDCWPRLASGNRARPYEKRSAP